MIGMIALVALLTKNSIEKKSTVAFVDDSGLFSGDDFNKERSIYKGELKNDPLADKASSNVHLTFETQLH